ncbi:lactate utilization protein [Pleomorphomonas diazotrophica]|uniref:Lactate utilization protein n=2 Tax=Pleomorphomonas diazotrophica TaxID=1166257 RepID=A0A1I4TW31_9HYPH|nr:LUD domain-containing protein [Pleomorphomonas diazotrophica]PKR87718.1 lactate utilization protein [Pleomorphomonas diazotrophica]SFM80837.1 L-lactate dehydrogenase complex protein LldG [Pleomorphomonas diazotrophica]
MSSRDAILGRIRRSLDVSGTDATRLAAARHRLVETPVNVVPARGQLPDAERVELFVRKAGDVFASVARLDKRDDIPAAVADYLRTRNLPQAIRHGSDPRLAGLPWGREAQLAVTVGPSDGKDLAGLSYADSGVAETGTVVLTSGQDNPTTLNFLPDHHIVAVDASTIAGDYETVWTNLRRRFGAGAMPRTVNFITGPSRSADIEETLLLGAHGPRSLHILVVG